MTIMVSNHAKVPPGMTGPRTGPASPVARRAAPDRAAGNCPGTTKPGLSQEIG